MTDGVSAAAILTTDASGGKVGIIAEGDGARLQGSGFRSGVARASRGVYG